MLERAKSKFKGWVNGVYLYPAGDEAAGLFEAQGLPCSRDQIKEFDDERLARLSPYWFGTPAYMPPGTLEMTYPLVVACGHDPAFLVERRYEVRPAGGELLISMTKQRFFVGFPASKDRVRTGTIRGLPAVFIDPLTPEGYGQSAVIVRRANGLLRIQTDVLPLAQLRKIAESMVS